MTLTVKAVATARRNLAQRIQRFLDALDREKRGLTAWEADQLATALRYLGSGAYREGEEAMLRTERAEAFEPAGYQPKRADVPDFRAELLRLLAEEG